MVFYLLCTNRYVSLSISLYVHHLYRPLNLLLKFLQLCFHFGGTGFKLANHSVTKRATQGHLTV